MATRFVSYLDVSGVRLGVEVNAESLYEAAVLAVRTLEEHDCAPGDMSQLEIEVRTTVKHIVTLKRVKEWLHGGAKNPKEAVVKERLRQMI